MGVGAWRARPIAQWLMVDVGWWKWVSCLSGSCQQLTSPVLLFGAGFQRKSERFPGTTGSLVIAITMAKISKDNSILARHKNMSKHIKYLIFCNTWMINTRCTKATSYFECNVTFRFLESEFNLISIIFFFLRTFIPFILHIYYIYLVS